MTEPLVVDSSRLKAAGTTLRGLTFPAPPPSISVAGTDSVSAAIYETLPIIESPVIDGLRDVEAALTRTGSSIATAADIYADTDQRIGDHMSQAEFVAPSEKPGGGASAGRLTGITRDQLAGAQTDGEMSAQQADGEMADEPADQPADDGTPSAPGTPAPRIGEIVPQLGQIVGTAGNAAQNLMQGVQGAVGSMSAVSSTPAQLADDTKADQSSADQAQLVDATIQADNREDQQPEALAEGAAPGDPMSEKVPMPAPTSGRPDTTHRGIDL
jgi:hypothetical protein